MQNIDNRVKMIDRVLDRFWSPGFGDFDDFDDYDKIDFSRLLKKRQKFIYMCVDRYYVVLLNRDVCFVTKKRLIKYIE